MRLGRYEVLAPLGAGGMGEVYRARDVELDRTVAVKVLPPHVASQSELRARFEREARAISALNHPHICTLHDVGREGDIAFFVMELVDGESLAARLARGKLPLDQALLIAAQIAAALSAAHRRGIVHRDLKPANVMLTRTGVKLLDFGIARLTTKPDHDAATQIGEALTADGMIVGTLQYMAPEQLEGKPADARADLFSFGCMLYEMVSGRRAFNGASQASIINAIMSSEPPPLPELEPVAPLALERLVRKCLAKSADERWESAADLETELRWIANDGGSTGPRALTKRRAWLWPAALVAAAALVAIAFFTTRSSPTDARVLRLAIPMPTHINAGLLSQQLAISPDGRFVVVVAQNDAGPALWMRALDSGATGAIRGTERAVSPFWSPDSKSIAFAADGKLQRLPRDGGDAETICDVSPGTIIHAAWGHDGTIVFGELTGRAGLFRVPADGGTPRPLAGTDVGSARRAEWPVFVGDSKTLLYCVVGLSGGIELMSLTLDSPEPPKSLGAITSRAIVAGDRMLFVRDGSLYAQRFDVATGRRSGEPIRLATSVSYYRSLGSAAFDASGDTIAYLTSALDSRLTWFDRAGNAVDVAGVEHARVTPRLSPDGRRAVHGVTDPRDSMADLWITDLQRGGTIRFTSTPWGETMPVWSPDGSTIAYSTDRDGPPHIFVQTLAGSAPVEVTKARSGIQYVRDWTPGGIILFDQTNPTTRRDIYVVDPRTHDAPRAWLQTPAIEHDARASSDGRWVAFASNASGKDEVYVAPFARPFEAVQVSSGGGIQPAWRRDGAELFYMTADNAIYSVAIRTTPQFDAAPPKLLFRSAEGTWDGFDAAADGQRFLVTRVISGPRTHPIEVIANWRELLPGH
ncbi:MAG TPA: protein kinase [Thermoanaerobaculia bacterium]|nr:protein kinase [Thermoanaerobaculia bacterium]